MADQYGFDLANVLANAEDIRGARLRNRLGMEAADRDAAARGEVANVMSSMGGPLSGLAAIDPERAGQLQTFIGNLKGEERANYERAIDQAGRALAFVKTSDDPEAAYQVVLGQLPEDIRSKAPPTYDAQWVDMQLAQAQSVNDILKGGATAFDATDGAPSGYAWADPGKGSLKPIPGGPKDPAAAGGEVGALEVGIANAIRSTVVQQFGGTYDPMTGEFAFGDPSQSGRALEVMALAEDFAAKGDNPANAVKKAFAAAGPVPAAEPAAGADPLGLGL